jgi:hypothetical protein
MFHFRYAINTKSYCFDKYPQRLNPKRTYSVSINFTVRVWTIFQLYHGENDVLFDEYNDDVHFVVDQPA